MKVKKFIRYSGLCLLVLAVSNLWFAACASGGGSHGERGLAVVELPYEELSYVEGDFEVFPQLGHSNYITSLAFSPGGRYIVSGSNDNTVKLWDVAIGREIRTFTGHSNEVTSVAFSPDGRQLLSGSWDKTLKLWDAATGDQIRTFSRPEFTLTAQK